MELFAKSEVNTGRQFELDLAKVLCFLQMVCIHCLEELLASSAQAGSKIYQFLVLQMNVFLGTAVVFMLCMGASISYSRRNYSKHFISRGCRLFFLGYVLNLLRDAIPTLIAHFLGHSPFSYVAVLFLTPDILQFAGLALMLFGFLKKHNLSDKTIFAISLAMSLVGSLARFIDMGHYVTNCFAGLFFGTVDSLYPDLAMGFFPLLNWFVFVVIGYLYGKLLRHCTDLNRYYKIVTPFSAVILLFYAAIIIPNHLNNMGSDITFYYQMSTPYVFIQFFSFVFLTGLFHFLSKPLPSIARKIITNIGMNITPSHCIHWVIIGWTKIAFIIFGFEWQNASQLLLLAVLIFVVSTALAAIYKSILQKRKKQIA